MAYAGQLPVYKYRPHISGESPRVRTHSARRARYFGDTYYRATEPGQAGNRISTAIVQVDSPTIKGTFYVTNHNTIEKENVSTTGNPTIEVDFLDCRNLNFNETITFTSLTPTELRAVYSISLQIAPGGPITIQNSDLGIVRLGDLFTGPKGISLQLNAEHTQLTPGDTVVLKARVQSYPLTWIIVNETAPDGTTTDYKGWDIAKLRADVTANPLSWIQMPERSREKETDPPIQPPIDYQDEGFDAPVLETYDIKYLGNGDGLPVGPDEQKTGPSRSIVHLNYSETDNGMMGVVSKIYEWSGTTHINGEWLSLF